VADAEMEQHKKQTADQEAELMNKSVDAESRTID
jgi:hypothetical protein